MKVLITGGAGYIGSHVAHALSELGHEIVVLDNFYSGQRRALPASAEVVEGSVGDSDLLARIFSGPKFDAVLHFAAHIEVGESVTDPGKYYRNNTIASLALFESCRLAGVKNIIFSSTAAVYGEPASHDGLTEDTPLQPMNPYGASKMMSERMLQDVSRASMLASKQDDGLRFIILRYFNAAGARRDLAIGQATPRATHLIKIASQAALGLREGLCINGTDYPTPDGTCLRDYIHIEDLAQAHVDALNYLVRGGVSEIFNVGYGRASSVLEVIAAMQNVSGKQISVTRGPRRPGDASVVMGNCDKIRRVLGWQPRFDNLELICQTAFAWEKKLIGLRESGAWR